MDIGFDHPDVVHALRTGYPSPLHPERRWCPVCERTLRAKDIVYTYLGDVVGCMYCIEVASADEVWE